MTAYLLILTILLTIIEFLNLQYFSKACSILDMFDIFLLLFLILKHHL